jgi:N-acetylglucosaminyldiphosphoundecaprenol N-acetyl-beta-D-mannosaminyltransferase
MDSSVNILGVHVSAINMDQALETITDWLARREPHYVCVTGAHGILESRREKGLRRIHNNAGLVTPDGMSLVWLSQLKGFRQVKRVYGPDLLLHLCKLSTSKGYRHFFYGGSPIVLEKLSNNLIRQFPDLKIVGMHSPPFRPATPEEDSLITQSINHSGADIVWVGLSTPKQEYWMSEHTGKINAPVLIGVGAAFDFLSGSKKQAPRWVQRAGMEWLFRLGTEPRRLWRRYAQYPLFLALVIAQSLGVTRYD